MKIRIKYFDKDYPRLKKIPEGDWRDLRIDKIKKWTKGGDREFDFAEYMSVPYVFKDRGLDYKKGDVIRFGLGVAMELPEGYEAEIRSRSSTFEKYGLILTNCVGMIDNSYKGDNDEWQAEYIAMRDGRINRFDRVCQFRIWKNQPEFEFEEVESLGNTDRGGYGSTD